MVKSIKTILAVAVLTVTGVLGFVYSGLFDVAANVSEPAVVRWLLQTTREHSIQRRAERITVPEFFDEGRTTAGGKAYSEMCAGCHGAPGQAAFLGAADMNPHPPNLAEVPVERTPSELFWVVKNGIRMTGMPAWGSTHTDEQIWDLVAFINRLPTLSPHAYSRMAQSGRDDEHDHEHNMKRSIAERSHEDNGNGHSH